MATIDNQYEQIMAIAIREKVEELNKLLKEVQSHEGGLIVSVKTIGGTSAYTAEPLTIQVKLFKSILIHGQVSDQVQEQGTLHYKTQ